MREVFAVALCCFCSCVSARSVDQPTAYGYHETLGVPKAQALMRTESLRIVGGSQVSSLTAHPHQAGLVTLLTSGLTSICGGSIISDTRVMTAAHCWWDGQSQARQFTVVLGSLTIFSGGTRVISSDVVVHPNWNTNAVINDIAIVRIAKVTFNNNIQAIPLPTLADVNQDFSGQTGVITGFGKTSDGQTSFPTTTALHQNSVSIITNNVCQQSFSIPIHNSHMCTSGQGGKGTCDGDSGGPITVVWRNRRTQVGIVSFGLADGCQRNIPSVYTRVTAFLNWINANL